MLIERSMIPMVYSSEAFRHGMIRYPSKGSHGG